MFIKVLGIGSHSTSFESTKPGLVGIINRAYSSSGVSQGSKAWGAGFLSFSPGIKLADLSHRTVRAPQLTQYIKEKVVGHVFEAQLRETRKEQEYLAVYRKSLEAPTHYLVVISDKIVATDQVDESPQLELIKETNGIILSEAHSLSKSGTTQAYEAVVILPVEGFVKTNFYNYTIKEDNIVRTEG
ncbi:hypothetical protein CEW46_21400 [Bacillus cereus]|nr:hypothetical protein CEW46_21400 [Bacillus cereus]